MGHMVFIAPLYRWENQGSVGLSNGLLLRQALKVAQWDLEAPWILPMGCSVCIWWQFGEGGRAGKEACREQSHLHGGSCFMPCLEWSQLLKTQTSILIKRLVKSQRSRSQRSAAAEASPSGWVHLREERSSGKAAALSYILKMSSIFPWQGCSSRVGRNFWQRTLSTTCNVKQSSLVTEDSGHWPEGATKERPRRVSCPAILWKPFSPLVCLFSWGKARVK